jgi:D-alanine-D-alanine ligase
MQSCCILYTESEFTPWKENIDYSTVRSIADALATHYRVAILHVIHIHDGLEIHLKSFDFVVNLCYGTLSCNQAEMALWLTENRINHLSSPGHSQLLAQDKWRMEQILRSAGMHVPPSFSHLEIIGQAKIFIAKPRHGGCHRGIHLFSGMEIPDNIGTLSDPKEYIIQPYLYGREFTVGIWPTHDGMGYEALPPIEIISENDQTYFIAGQEYGATRKLLFPDLKPFELESIQRAALTAHKLMGLQYFSRCDIRLHEDKVFVIDVNTMPNLHPTKSMFPALLSAHGHSIDDLFHRALRRNNLFYRCNQSSNLTV